jgi:ABC-type phosphate transport system substrate-binding protein
VKRLATSVALLAFLIFVSPAALAAEPEPGFSVIVHPTNATTALTTDELSRVFLKKVTKWKDGRSIVPIDLVEDSPVRRSFSQTVHHRKVPAISSYWQQQIFSGRAVPPREMDSEEEVVRFVVRSPGAIGYVSTKAPLKGVKILKIGD